MPRPALQSVNASAFELCRLPWADVLNGPPEPSTPPKKLPQRCFDAHYLFALLTEGFGFDPGSSQIAFVEKVGVGQPEWAYGAIARHLARPAPRPGPWPPPAALPLPAAPLAALAARRAAAGALAR